MSLNVGIARAVLDAAKPDVIVFDCFPHRAFAQLALTYNLPFVMCVREMKETAGYYQILRPVLDAARLILIPHDNNGPSFPEWLTHKAKCVGQIVRPAPSSSRPSRLATSRPLIVISGGGGGFPDTVDFYNLTLHAFKLCQQEVPECTGALVTGPLFRSWDRLLPVEGIRILPFEPNMLGLFATADLVLCQAGYNTVAELGTMNVPTICIPARRDYDDQFERANSLSKSNPLFEMHTESDPASLALRMTRMIAQGRGSVGTTVTSGTVPDGAYRAAFSLLEGWK
jgi:UDP-N-acetylglucosamine:LPS N-acetylglucosamine transferase